MSTPEDDLIRSELHSIKQRIASIENKLNLRETDNQPREISPAQTSQAPPQRSYEMPASEKISEESSTGKVLGAIAVVCFLLAGSFIIKLAIDSGWLTPARQLGLAVLFGFSLIGTGLAFLHRDRRYFSILPGVGVAILYMSAYAGALYFHLFSIEVGLVAAGLVSAFCLILFHRLRQDFYVVAAVLGTYASPLLLGVFQGATVDNMAFFFVWDVVFAICAIALRSRLMILVACYMALFGFMISFSDSLWTVRDEWVATTAVFQLVQFLIFIGSVISYSVRNQSALNQTEAIAFTPVLFYFYGVEYYLLNRIYPDLTPWLALGFAGFVYAIYLAAKSKLRDDMEASATLVTTFVAFVGLHAFYFQILPDRWASWFSVAVLLGLPLLFLRVAPKPRNFAIFVAALIVLLLNYFQILVHYPYGEHWELFTLNLIYGGAFLSFYLLATGAKWSGHPQWDWNGIWLFILFAADLQALAGLWRVAHQVDQWMALGWERFIVTTLWALFALSLLLWAKHIKDQVFARSSLFVLIIAASKGLLYDVSSTQPILRIFCFLILGGTLYFSGYVFRQIASWKNT